MSSTYSLKLLTRNCFIILICALFSSHTQTQKNISSHNSRQKEIRFHQSLSFSHFFSLLLFLFACLYSILSHFTRTHLYKFLSNILADIVGNFAVEYFWFFNMKYFWIIHQIFSRIFTSDVLTKKLQRNSFTHIYTDFNEDRPIPFGGANSLSYGDIEM